MEKYICKDNYLFENDYTDYELSKRFYIVWLLDINKHWYQEVDLSHFNLAKKEMWRNNKNELCIPYLLYTEYFIKTKEMDKPILVDKEIYDEIDLWQSSEKNHNDYIIKRYRNRKLDAEIENLATDKISTEEKVIHTIFEQQLLNVVQNNLTDTQLNIFIGLYSNDSSKTQIARNYGVSRQSIYENLAYIRKKLKKFLK